MLVSLSPGFQKLLHEPASCQIATLMPDGSPQITEVWVDTDGEHVIVNTARGRQKPRNLERDRRVAISIVDRNNPYHQANIRGEIVEMTTEGADAHIDRMAKKYLGKDTYPFRQPGEERLLLKIAPKKVGSLGLD